MPSSNGNIFRATGHLCGEFAGPRWTPHTKPVTRSFGVFFDLRLNNGWVNNGEAADLRRYRAHYDVTVMIQDGGLMDLQHIEQFSDKYLTQNFFNLSTSLSVIVPSRQRNGVAWVLCWTSHGTYPDRPGICVHGQHGNMIDSRWIIRLIGQLSWLSIMRTCRTQLFHVQLT